MRTIDEIHLSIARTFGSIRSDAVHGASYIANTAAQLLLQISESKQSNTLTAEQIAQLLRETSRKIEKLRPSMAPLAHIARRTWLATKDDDPEIALSQAQTYLRMVMKNGESIPEKIAVHLQKKVVGSLQVLTISRSATVLQVLQQLQSRITQIICLESRPGREGIDAAIDFSSFIASDKIQVISDSAVYQGLLESNCAIVGADALLGIGFFVNKIGTNAVACISKGMQVPLFVVADETKIAPADWVWRPEYDDNAQIIRRSQKLFKADAMIFEAVPSDLGTIISPNGVLTEDDIYDKAEEMRIGQ